MSSEQQLPAAPEPGSEHTTPAGEHRGEATAPAAPAGGSAQAQRPRPAYGEYAPEGWSWTPPGQENAGAGSPAAETAAGPTGDATAARPGTGRVPGVPHNLGAPGAANPRAVDPAPAQASPAPTANAQPAAGQQHYRGAAPQPGKAERSLLGDRIITIVLLVLGALGALYSAVSLYSLPASISLMGSALEISNFSVPAIVGTVGTVGALLIFAIYALNLIYSLQRVRARKLAFWVPLVAAVLAGIASVGFNAFAIAQVPELIQQLADPNAMSRLLDFFATQQQ